MTAPLPEDVRAALQGCVDEIQYLRKRATFPAGHWLVLQNTQDRACAILNADYRAKHGEPARERVT